MADNVIQKHGGKVGYENFKINKKTVASQDPNAVLSCLVDIKDVLQQILEGQLEADEITQPIIAAIESQTDALTASLQEICDKLDAGITVNAVQSGTWSVTIDGQPIETSLSTDNGNEVPNTAVFSEARYDYFGNQVGLTREVYSVLVNGEWQPYTLQASDVVGRCPPDIAPDEVEVAGGVDIPNESTAFEIPEQTVRTLTICADGTLDGEFDPVVINTPNGTQTLNVPGCRTFGSHEGRTRLDTSGFSVTTGANSNADMHWEV